MNGECPYCGVTFTGRGSLANHIKKSHAGVPAGCRKCPKCGEMKPLDEQHFKKNKSRPNGWEPWCKGCFNAYYRERTKNNPEQRREKERRYKERHPEKVAAKRKRAHAKARASGKNKYQNRLAWIRRTNYNMVKWRRRRALKMGAQGTHTTEQFYSRCEVHGWKCYYCSTPLTPQTVTEDHRIPLSRGGSDWPANLVSACMACNTSKHAKTEREFLLLKAGDAV